CDGDDTALLALRRPEWRAVVEVSTPVPGTVAAVLLHRGRVGIGLCDELLGRPGITASTDVIGECAQRRGEKPGEPNAIAPSLDADATHAVVPVTYAYEWKSVHAGGARLPQRAEAVFVHRRGLRAHLRQVIHLVLVRLEFSHGEEWNHFAQHSRVSGDADIVVHHVRQPGQVIREASADTAPALRMPPVLHVSLLELTCCSAQYVFACHLGLGVHER